jgi:alcohol dehydrogenase
MAEATHRKIYQLKAGNIKRLKIANDILEAPGPHEVQVAIKSIGLNFADLYAIWGLYSATPKGMFVPGLEYSGTITKVGKNSSYNVGQDVMGITKFGAYATHLNIDSRYVVPLPTHWDFDEGAAYLVQAMTAYYALVILGELHAGQKVLIHSAVGGVGLYANQIAKKMGAYTIGTTGSPAKLELIKSAGYDKGLVRSRSFKHDVRQATDDGTVDLILECIGGRILREGFELLAPEGRMVVYGAAQFTSPSDRPNYFKLIYLFLTRPKIDPLQLPNTNRALLGFNLIWLYNRVEKMHLMIKALEDLDLSKPKIGNIYGFDELPDAIRMLRSGKTSGKVIVKVSPSHKS